MPRLHPYEFLPDDGGRGAVLRDWQVLRADGAPTSKGTGWSRSPVRAACG